ncbi:hypothetical protein QR98_0059990 [Sarcoptes scabiei]|uniref:Uncharacterized protein n=1 Tax=Sarcoptes scabiei TaxID=52283 RepID=A0A132A956_SARSC|nr:hypothetical protein QR98_0059990 [Sarcoptes scabiei]
MTTAALMLAPSKPLVPVVGTNGDEMIIGGQTSPSSSTSLMEHHLQLHRLYQKHQQFQKQQQSITFTCGPSSSSSASDEDEIDFGSDRRPNQQITDRNIQHHSNDRQSKLLESESNLSQITKEIETKLSTALDDNHIDCGGGGDGGGGCCDDNREDHRSDVDNNNHDDDDDDVIVDDHIDVDDNQTDGNEKHLIVDGSDQIEIIIITGVGSNLGS